MIGYKSRISEVRQSVTNWIKMFWNNFRKTFLSVKLQRPWSCHHLQDTIKIIKRFRESGGVSVRQRQGWRSKLDVCDFQAHRGHCNKNRHDSLPDITAWTETTICEHSSPCKPQMQVKAVWTCEHDPETLGQSSKLFCGQINQNLKLFQKPWTLCSLD